MPDAQPLDPADFRMTPEELRRVFEERVVPYLFGGRTPSGGATVVFITGQPGAGKTRAQEYVLREHPDAVVIDRDDLRKFQQREDAWEHVDRDASAFPYVTEEVAGALRDMAIDYAVEHGYTAVLENSFRTDYPLEVAAKTTPAAAPDGSPVGDRPRTPVAVEVVVVVTPLWQSRLDTLTRYLLPGAETPRWTQDASHEDCQPHIPPKLDALEKRGNTRGVTLIDRAGALLYRNRRLGTVWERVAGAGAALTAAWGRPPTPEHARRWLDQYWSTLALATAQGALTPTTLPRVELLHGDADRLARIAYGHDEAALRRHQAWQGVQRYVNRASRQGVRSALLPASPALFLMDGKRLDALLSERGAGSDTADVARPHLEKERRRRQQIPAPQAERENRLRGRLARGPLAPARRGPGRGAGGPALGGLRAAVPAARATIRAARGRGRGA
ncbi:zeta toxin family protein [Nocardiopsis sp. NPDC101807]|uniref:zeta toxin family protein n=1 Tax=Nocardiopsis sp. NPDC101807 TaxID=3364339 RepID=UPI0038281497